MCGTLLITPLRLNLQKTMGLKTQSPKTLYFRKDSFFPSSKTKDINENVLFGIC